MKTLTGKIFKQLRSQLVESSIL